MKYNIKYVEGRCSGCLCCQLACSRALSKCFQPSAAAIQIVTSGNEYRATFSEDCAACGFCADNCLFDALRKVLLEGSP